MWIYTSQGKRLFSLAIAVASPFLVVSLIFSLNRLIVSLGDDKQVKTTSFDVVRPNEPVKNMVKPTPPKKVVKAKSDSLAPDLSALLGGGSFGLSQFEWLGEDAIGGSLMDDIKNAAFTADTVEQAPVVRKTASLDYPAFARKKGIAGYVLFSLLISPSGKVEKHQIIESSPPGVFDQVALASVRQWKFDPGRDRGQAVAVWVEQKVSFSLN